MSNNSTEPLAFADEHYIALGRMVVGFQSLEQTITQSLLGLMHPHDLLGDYGFTRTVVNELSFADRLRLLSHFVETTPATHFVPEGTKHETVKLSELPEVMENLRLGLKLASEAQADRNALTHSQWFENIFGGPPRTVLRMKFRAAPKKLQVTHEYMEPRRIIALVEKMQEASRLISGAVEHLIAFPRSQEMP